VALILVSPQTRGFPNLLFPARSYFFQGTLIHSSSFPSNDEHVLWLNISAVIKSLGEYIVHYRRTLCVCVCVYNTHTHTHARARARTFGNSVLRRTLKPWGAKIFQKYRSHLRILGAIAVGDMEQVPNWWPTNISHHNTKFSGHGDLAPGICTPLLNPNQPSVNFIMRIFTGQSQWPPV